MAKEYIIKPGPGKTRLGDLLSQLPHSADWPSNIKELNIEQIRFWPDDNRCLMVMDGKMTDQAVIDSLISTLRPFLPGIEHLEVELAVSLDSDQTPEEEGVSESQDSADDYMERILLLAKEKGNPTSNTGPVNSGVLLGSEIKQSSIPMSSINDEEKSGVVEGEIFLAENKPMRSGRTMLSFDFSDGTDSLTGKLFLENGKADLADKLLPGVYIKVRGPIKYDPYTQELTITPEHIQLLDNPLVRTDHAPKKRVELHLHTKMSSLDGLTEIEQVVAQAARWGHPAVAITDHGVVQAFPRAYSAGKKHGIKIIFGLEGYLVEKDIKEARNYHIILLAQNRKGLFNLYKLVSLSHIDHFYRRPRIPKELLNQYREGLLVGSACEAGEFFQALLNGLSDSAVEQIAFFYDYFEIQPLANNQFLIGERIPDEQTLIELNKKVLYWGEKLQKPVVATGDVHFLHPHQAILRTIVLAGHGMSETEYPTPLYFRTTEEMLKEFSYLSEEQIRQVVIENPLKIASEIENLRPIPDGFYPPVINGAEDQIGEMVKSRSIAKYGNPLPELVKSRIDQELKSIIGNGFASLYLIASRLVEQSNIDGYMVGSRGSVGSSFVAFLCNISEVNPLPAHYYCPECHYFEQGEAQFDAGPDLPRKQCPKCQNELRREGFNIPFETFLGFKGDKVPDIDLNFSGEYQSIAHKYAEKLLVNESLYRAGTISTLQERTAYGFVKKYMEDENRKVRNAEINRLVQGITGVRKTTGQHPGGLIVVPQGHDINEFTPVQYPANDRKTGTITTHFEYHTMEDQLVKLDLLGHDAPTIMKMLQELTNIKAEDIPLDDPEVLAIFSGWGNLGLNEKDGLGEIGTLGIPEYGTGFVRQMLNDTKPKTFADLVRIMGLSHGTNVWLNNAQDLINRQKLTLSEVIAARDDIMLYLISKQMEPAAAFRIMEQVRKGRGLSEEDEKLMNACHIPEWYIQSCKQISYLFPKAHAVAYAVMAYYVAYFKVHYPPEFYAVYFTMKAEECDSRLLVAGIKKMKQFLNNLEKKGNGATAKEKNMGTILEVAIEAILRGIKFLSADVYASAALRFKVEKGNLRCPLVSLPGVGINAAKAIESGYNDKEYVSKEDFQRRTGVNKTVISVLEENGSLPALPESDQLTLF
jgi:DNA polymerase-3 subunit alpha (Gram-positive type)